MDVACVGYSATQTFPARYHYLTVKKLTNAIPNSNCDQANLI